jgi:hypothetical protein
MNATCLRPVRCDICHNDNHEVPATVPDFHGCNWCGPCVKAVEDMRATSPAFNALVECAIGLDVMRAYRRDLWLHDRNAISARPQTPFLWAIGDSGTTMCWASPDAGKPWTHATAESMCRTLLQCSRPHIFIWDGKTLRHVDHVRAAYFLLTGT